MIEMARGKRGTAITPLHPRDVQYLKPTKFQHYLTLAEVSREVKRDASWIRRLEKAGKIPMAQRVQRGELSVRLWSPRQVEEIKEVLSKLRPGRPRK